MHIQDRGEHALQMLSVQNAIYDPLHYVLFHPYGGTSWSRGIPLQRRHAKRTDITDCEYYRYQIQHRPNVRSSLFAGRRLYLQWLVDMLSKHEHIKLGQIKGMQSQLRSDLYRNLADAKDGSEQKGRKIILPATFAHSPRNMNKKYQDAMAIQRAVGKFPSIFLTMTTNSKWDEVIQECGNVPPEMLPQIRCRVFRLKYLELIRDIKENKVFGESVAHIYSIEFQKRGAPHIHLVIFLKNNIPPDDYDKIVSAEIPDKGTHPRLHAAVVKHMLHGPCIPDRSSCMKRGECSKQFPKPFCQETVHNDNMNYVQYRRRSPANGGHSHEKRGNVFDNRHVVPHCPYLLLKYDCHINVEICTSMGAIKYLFKYIYKGPDLISVELRTFRQRRNAEYIAANPGDEAAKFLDARYYTPDEGVWHTQLEDTKFLGSVGTLPQDGVPSRKAAEEAFVASLLHRPFYAGLLLKNDQLYLQKPTWAPPQNVHSSSSLQKVQ